MILILVIECLGAIFVGSGHSCRKDGLLFEVGAKYGSGIMCKSGNTDPNVQTCLLKTRVGIPG